jgi:CBS domain-containing protein
MQVKDMMTANVHVIAPDASLREAAAMMRDLDIGALPVCENDRVVGFVTDRDITIRATAAGKSPDECQVRQVMSQGVVHCSEDASVEEAERLMKDRQVRRLAVLDGNQRLAGILSLGDMALELDSDEAGDVLERISEPPTVSTI